MRLAMLGALAPTFAPMLPTCPSQTAHSQNGGRISDELFNLFSLLNGMTVDIMS